MILPTFYVVDRVTKKTAFLKRLDRTSSAESGRYIVHRNLSGPVILDGYKEVKVKLQTSKNDITNKLHKEYVKCEDPYLGIPAQFKPKHAVFEW